MFTIQSVHIEMDEEKLICLVQKYNELYDRSDKTYHDQQRKQNVWEEIAGEMNIPVSECKKRWNSLRDAYTKSIKSQETRSGDSSAKKKSWRFHKQMTFLRPFLSTRNQITNVDASDSSDTETLVQDIYTEEDSQIDDVTSLGSTPSCSSMSRSSSATRNTQKKSSLQQKKNAPTAAEVLQNYFKEKRNTRKPDTSDPTTKFFECMAETVRTFHPQLQIEVKSQIFGIVNNAETRNMNFSLTTPTASQESAFTNKPSQFPQFYEQNQVTIRTPQFHQEQYQLPDPQSETQHPLTMSRTPMHSQPQAYRSTHTPYQPYPQQRRTSIPSPSIYCTKNMDNNDNTNDNTNV